MLCSHLSWCIYHLYLDWNEQLHRFRKTISMTYPYMNKMIALALYEALTKDPFYITMEQTASGDAAESKEAMLTYMDYSMKEALAHGELLIPQNRNYGASIWSKPVDAALSRHMATKKKLFLKDYFGRKSLDTYSRIVGYMSKEAEEVVSDTFWYLSILGISPDLQGRGLGGRSCFACS